MAEKDALHRVSMEPLLYAFQAPRTIAKTLSEYEDYLRHERGLSSRRLRATLGTLERLLDPIDAPLASVTKELLHTLLRAEATEKDGVDFSINLAMSLYEKPARLEVPRALLAHARHFFRWAVRRGYVRHNPLDGFEELSVPMVEEPANEWLA